MTTIEKDILHQAADYATALAQFQAGEIGLMSYNATMILLLSAASKYRHPSVGIIAKAMS